MSSFYIVLTSGDRFAGYFNQTFDKPYNLKGNLEVAISSLDFEGSDPAFIFCDLVEYSHVKNNEMKFLDFFHNTAVARNDRPAYVKLARKRFSSINVEFKAKPDYAKFNFSAPRATCVLHFR